jgi:hypothetical protein
LANSSPDLLESSPPSPLRSLSEDLPRYLGEGDLLSIQTFMMTSLRHMYSEEVYQSICNGWCALKEEEEESVTSEMACDLH